MADHPVADGQPVQHLDFAGTARADADFAAHHGVAVGRIDQQHGLPIAQRHQRFFRYHQRVARVFQQLDLHQQAGFEDTIRVGQHRPDANRTGRRVDSAVDRLDLACEYAPGKGVRGCADRQARAQGLQVGAGHLEIQVHQRIVVERGDRIARLHQRSDAQVA